MTFLAFMTCILSDLPVNFADRLYSLKQPALVVPEFGNGNSGYADGYVVLSGNYSVTFLLVSGSTGVKKNPIVTYPLIQCLCEGKVDSHTSDQSAYLTQDLKPGSTVLFTLHRENKSEYHIARIQLFSGPNEEPIPASQKPDAKRPYHVWQNAINGWEKKGIAIPDNILKQFHMEHPPPLEKPNPTQK
jgi:hypothetical protein